MKSIKVSRVLAVLLSLFSLMCSDDQVATRLYPSIDTKAVTEISSNGANLNGEILNAGTSGIIDHGFVYNVVRNPTLDNSDRISLGESLQTGGFSAFANRNLVKEKKYYVKAYAVSRDNDFTVYGQEVEFISQGGSAPEIVDFNPRQGVIGDTVIISGSGFSSVPANNIVRFGGAVSQVVKASQDSLWCLVPTFTLPGENELTITVGQLSVKPEQKFTLKAISLISFTPSSISFGDTVTITGLNFPLKKQLVTAMLLLKNGTIVSILSTQLKVVIANEVVIPESTIKITAGAQTITTTESIKLLKPVINSFTPEKGTKDTEVTISGKYFSPVKANNKVEINGTIATLTDASTNTLKIKTPGGITSGSYPLSITVASQTEIAATQFEIVKTTISSISPLNGTWGTTITILGENFGSTLTDNIVKFDDVQATVISTSATELKVIVPNNLLTKNSVISVNALTVDNQTATFNSPFVLDPPSITSFTPDNGKSTSQVTIVGENFNPVKNNQTVKFGDKQAEVLSASSTQLLVKLPTSLADSDVNIEVYVAEQTALSSTTFHLISPWKRIADFAGNARTDAMAFSIGSYGFVGLGTKESFSASASTYKYDPSIDSWELIPAFSYFGHGGSGSYVNLTAFVISDDAYVGMGCIGTQGPFNEFSRYNATDNKWYDAADCGNSNDGIEGAVGYTLNGYGYITSGRNYSNGADFRTLQYDPVTEVWTRKADFPGPNRTEATGFSIGDKAYLTTGRRHPTTTLVSDLWVYDPSLNRWDELAPIPGSVRWQSTSFSINGLGYLFGGASNYDAYYNLLKDFWVFNPNTNSWTRLEDFPGEARAGAVAFVLNGKAYVGTGLGGPTVYLKDFWEFDPSKL